MAIAARPDLIKPNREELAELAGHPVDTIADVAGADGASALAEAVAWGSAAAALPGSRMPGPGDISHAGVRVTALTDLTSGNLTARL